MNPNYSYDNFQVEMNSLDEVNNDSNSSNSKNINKELENNNNDNNSLNINNFNSGKTLSNYIPKLNNNIYQNNQLFNININNYISKREIPYQSYSINELIEKSDILCRNQSGCRFLQKKIDENPKIVLSIFSLIKNKINNLIIDPFGNYFIQKLLEYLNLNQINEIITNYINKNFLEICLNPHGTRVIQKLIERIYNYDLLLEKFNVLLNPNLFEIIMNQNSTHIIIKYMNLIKFPKNKNILFFIQKNLFSLATHKHSCCTIQKAIETLENPRKKIILMNLAQISNKLFNDQFGNYVVQFALSMKEQEVNTIIINNYLNDFKNNSCGKYSSNVFEKCFECSNLEIKIMIIKNICNYSNVQTLLYDIYGNNILLQIIKESLEPYKTYFFQLIGSLIDGLKVFPYGSIIFHKFISNFPNILNFVNKNSIYTNNNINGIYYHSYNNIELQNRILSNQKINQ